MVFNATFNNISVTSWRSVLLVEETGGPGENYRPVASHCQTLSHYVVHFTLIDKRKICKINIKTSLYYLYLIMSLHSPNKHWRRYETIKSKSSPNNSKNVWIQIMNTQNIIITDLLWKTRNCVSLIIKGKWPKS
jgi:hypothetical protein